MRRGTQLGKHGLGIVVELGVADVRVVVVGGEDKHGADFDNGACRDGACGEDTSALTRWSGWDRSWKR